MTPTGYPAWVRANEHTSYGGHTSKTNYQSLGVVNAQTDVGAEALTRMAADLEAVHRTAAFCTIRVLCNDSSPAAPTIEFVNQMTGLRITSYAGNAAPTGFPSGTRNGTGDVTLTWAASYNDSYSVAGTVNIAHAVVSLHGSTAGDSTVELLDSNVDTYYEAVRLRATNAAGTALADARMSLDVCTGL